jgi:hypothetical protein
MRGRTLEVRRKPVDRDDCPKVKGLVEDILNGLAAGGA